MRTFRYNVDSELFTSWSPGIGGIIGESLFSYLYIEKIFFSRTSRPITIKHDINHPWVQRILNSSNKAPGLLQRGDNHTNVKMG
jgi:hypothetical protein